MIFDCFTFYNELDVLELRLRELYDAVDRFVLVEATRTHAGRPKPLFFAENRGRYAPFLDKIRHIVVDDMPEAADAWVRENFQRNAILRGLEDVAPDDLVLVSDADEIVRPDLLAGLAGDEHLVFGFRLDLAYFRFNYFNVEGPEAHVVWPVAARAKLLARNTPQKLRDARFWLHLGDPPGQLPGHARVFDRAGWHFSFVGDSGHVANKLRNYAHQENNRPDFLETLDLDRLLAEERDLFGRADYRWRTVPLDWDLPRALRAEPERFRRHLLLDAAGLVALGRQQEAEGRLDAAAALYGEAVARDPGHAEGHTALARALRRAGHLEQALAAVLKGARDCGRLSRADSPLLGIAADLGSAAFAAEDGDLAARCFQAFDGLRPNHAVMRRNLGTACHKAGLALMPSQPAAARRLFAAGLNYAPRLPDLHNALAQAELGERPYETACHLLSAVEAAPEDGMLFHNLWQVLTKLGTELGGALPWAELALKRPAPYAALIGRGNALMAAGDRTGAEAAFRAAHDSRPSLPFALSRLGCLYAAQGRLEDADALFQRAAACGLPSRDQAIRLGPTFLRSLIVERLRPLPDYRFGGAAPAPEAGLVVVAGADMGYFRRFAGSFVNSVARNLPGAHIHFHIVNPDAELDALVAALARGADGCTIAYSAEEADLARPDEQARTHYACARFLVLPQLLRRYARPVLFLDIDLVVMRDPTPLFEQTAEAELAFVGGQGYSLWNQFWADTILIRPTARSIEYFRTAGDYMRHFLRSGRGRWFLDQIALYSVYRSLPAAERPRLHWLPTTVHRLNVSLAPDGRIVGNDDAYVWSVRASLPSHAAQVRSPDFARFADPAPVAA